MTPAPLPGRPRAAAAPTTGPGLVDDETAALLRDAVGRLRTRQTQQLFDLTLHVGRLGGRHARFVVRPPDRVDLDRGVRTDLVARLLQQVADTRELPGRSQAHASVWLTRPGSPCEEDDDHWWHAAARSACSSVACTLDGFWVVTRTGWLDLVTGECRRWTRLRL